MLARLLLELSFKRLAFEAELIELVLPSRVLSFKYLHMLLILFQLLFDNFEFSVGI